MYSWNLPFLPKGSYLLHTNLSRSSSTSSHDRLSIIQSEKSVRKNNNLKKQEKKWEKKNKRKEKEKEKKTNKSK